MYCLLAQVGEVCPVLEAQAGPGLGSKCQGLDDPVCKAGYIWGTDHTNVSQMMRREGGPGKWGKRRWTMGPELQCGMNTVALTAPSADEELQMYVCTHITYTSLGTCLEGSIHMHKFPNYIQWKDLVAITSLCVCVCVCVLVAQSCLALCNPMN